MVKNPLIREIYQERTRVRELDTRGYYFRDQTAIIHSMPFRRLKHKTQVFLSPENDHVCTRIEHVLHVGTIAATICKGLKENGWDVDSELAYTIGLCHDLGHAPFGHTGEDALNVKLGERHAFIHEVNSYRVIEHLANNGNGLNLTYAVKDGALCHNGEKFERFLKPKNTKNDLENIRDRNCIPTSYEGCIVRFSDKIAYLGRDIEDAILAGLIELNSIPEKVRKELGDSNGKIIESIVNDMIESSIKSGDTICLSDEKFELINELKEFNYQNIYKHEKLEEYRGFCYKIIIAIFNHLEEIFEKNKYNYEAYQKSNMKIDNAFGSYIQSMEAFYNEENASIKRIITDYISGMTDAYAINCMRQISLPPYFV